MKYHPSFQKRYYFLVFLLVIFFTPLDAAISSVINEIAQDFKPISGYVVMVGDGEYIIDLDDTKGISEGDIFSISKPGKKIIHPITGKVLGTLKEVKGVLKVTRIKSGYSFARALDKTEGIKKGDPILRYDNLRALFWDYTGHGRKFFIRLQSTLPDLKWQDYDTAQHSKPDNLSESTKTDSSLAIILTRDKVEVRGPDSYTIHTYPPPEYLSAAIKIGLDQKTDATPRAASVPVIFKQASPITPQKGVNRSALFKPDFENVKTIDVIPSASVMADFVKDKNQLLMASTDGTAIEVFEVKDKLFPRVKALPVSPGQILALKWWQPEEMGPLYLTVVSWSGKSVNGMIFQLKGQHLIKLNERISRILGTFDMDADGRPETLLGQNFDGENFFGTGIKELKWVNGKIKSVKTTVLFPRRFTVLGSLFADVTNNGKLETIFIRNGILYIYSGKERLYASPKHMGSSLSFLIYDIDPGYKSIQTTSTAFEVSPVVADIDNDGQLEIIAIAAEKDFLGGVAAAPGIKKSWIEVFKFRDGQVVTGKLGDEMYTPLQGLEIDGKRVLFVATKAGNIFGKAAQNSSHLLSYWIDF